MRMLLLAEFTNSTRFIEAARRVRAARHRLVDAYSPFPVEGLLELLEHRRSYIRVAMFIGGIAMALAAYLPLCRFYCCLRYRYSLLSHRSIRGCIPFPAPSSPTSSHIISTRQRSSPAA